LKKCGKTLEVFQNFYKEEDFVTDKTWPPNCTDVNKRREKSGSEKSYKPNINYDPSMKNFEILLPLANKQEQIHVCNFNEFFTAIRIGNVTPDQLFIRPVPDPNNTSTETVSLKNQPKKRTLRTTKPIDYKEDEEGDEQQSDDDEKGNEKLDEKSEEEEDADIQNHRQKSKKQLPKKQKWYYMSNQKKRCN